MAPPRHAVRVARVADIAARIRLFELVPAEGAPLPAFAAGAHVVVRLPSGTERHYSLCNDPSETHRYVIAVLREGEGRGGSREMHEAVPPGHVLTIAGPFNNFPLAPGAHSSLLVAGGIGITPILCMARALAAAGSPFELVYLTRSREETAFLNVLCATPLVEHVRLHHDGGLRERQFDLARLLAEPGGRHVYCCGPAGLMEAVRSRSAHWPADTVHFEYFSGIDTGPRDGDGAFTVSLARRGVSVEVAAGQSILDALLGAGIEVDHNCCEGVCGTCIVRSLEGEVDHRDSILSEAERKAGDITICCSRALGPRLVLDI